MAADHFIATMPLSASSSRVLDPAPPAEVLEAARRLRYRDFLTVGLIVEREDVFPDNWIYVHSPEVKRRPHPELQELEPRDGARPGAHAASGSSTSSRRATSCGACEDRGAARPRRPRDARRSGCCAATRSVDGTVVRMPQAYPGLRRRLPGRDLPVLREYLRGFANLQLVGRNGQHRYNNQDHSMLTGMLAARNVAGESHDVWAVNVEDEYHEEIRGSRAAAIARRRPRRRRGWSRTSCARRSRATTPLALGGAVGIVAATGLLLATAALLLRGGEVVGPNLSLLGHYLFGFDASWRGAAMGTAEAGVGGFALGFLLGRSINWLVDRHEMGIRRRLEYASAVDPFGAMDQ